MAKSKAAQQDSRSPKVAAGSGAAAESPVEQKADDQEHQDELDAAQGDSDESPVPPKPRPKGNLGLYPEGTMLFEYQPKGGGEKLYFPMEFEKPEKIWLWELSQMPFLNQTWAWMNRAGVPKAIQRQVVLLPDDEYPDPFNAWFEAMGGGATPGE